MCNLFLELFGIRFKKGKKYFKVSWEIRKKSKEYSYNVHNINKSIKIIGNFVFVLK